MQQLLEPKRGHYYAAAVLVATLNALAAIGLVRQRGAVLAQARKTAAWVHVLVLGVHVLFTVLTTVWLAWRQAREAQLKMQRTQEREHEHAS